MSFKNQPRVQAFKPYYHHPPIGRAAPLARLSTSPSTISDSPRSGIPLAASTWSAPSRKQKSTSARTSRDEHTRVRMRRALRGLFPRRSLVVPAAAKHAKAKHPAGYETTQGARCAARGVEGVAQVAECVARAAERRGVHRDVVVGRAARDVAGATSRRRHGSARR
jgi:hypothetical protein